MPPPCQSFGRAGSSGVLPFCIFLIFFAGVLEARAERVIIDPSTNPSDNSQPVPSPAIVNGHPAVAYADDVTHAVKFARAADPDGTAWDPPVVVDASVLTGRVILHIVNGHPAVCYAADNAAVSKIYFSRALDPSGTAWSPAVTVAAGDIGHFSMALVNGHPAVSFGDYKKDALLYTRALDANGTAWGTAETIPNIDTRYDTVALTLKEVQGQPAIMQLSTGGISYGRYSGGENGRWGTTTISYAFYPFYNFSHASMEVVDGCPAISYFSAGDNMLHYIRATGTDFLGTLPVRFTPEVNPNACSLAVVQGKPAMACFSGEPYAFNYRQALDSEGATAEAWGPRKLVGDVGYHPVLHVVNGHPAITSFGDAGLQFLRALDASGNTWPSRIGVTIDGRAHLDGDTYDFQKAIQGTPAEIPLHLSIVNAGGTDFRFLGYSFEGPDAAEFSLDAPAGDVITPQAGLAFTLRHTPARSGSKQAVLHLLTDATGTLASYEINLKAHSLPDIDLFREDGGWIQEGDTASYPVTPAGQIRDFTFNIRNGGGGALEALNVTLSGPDAGSYSVAIPPPASVPPQTYTSLHTSSFTIRHSPQAPGGQAVSVRVTSNVTGDKNPYDFILRTITGTPDYSFRPEAPTSVSVALSGDGRIILNQETTLAAFHAHGSRDAGFSAPAFTGGVIRALTVQKDGKILTGGSFESISGNARRGLARLLPDGKVDTSFNPGIDGIVESVIVQPDDRMIITGEFTSVQGVPRRNMARLLPDGSPDTAFDPSPDGRVVRPLLLPDGKIMVSGVFASIGGASATKQTVRLNADGTQDPAFPGLDNWVIAVQPDGKLLVLIDGILTRLHPDSTPDASFSGPASSVERILLQADGSLIIRGLFSSVHGVPRSGMARLHADGSLDHGFDARGNAADMAGQADGKLVLAGGFTSVGEMGASYLARLNTGPAISLLTTSGGTTVRWEREGTAPETNDVTFDIAPTGTAAWTRLGAATRIAGGWELTGLTLPATFSLRAQARTGASVIETHASFPSVLETWRELHFGSSANTGDGADAEDPDGDGLSNFIEFAFGLNPRQHSGSTLPVFVMESPPHWVAAEFTAPAHAAGFIQYGAEYSTSLRLGTWVPIPDSGTGNTHIFRTPFNEGRIFTRFTLRVR